jgi:hypothetical protein
LIILRLIPDFSFSFALNGYLWTIRALGCLQRFASTHLCSCRFILHLLRWLHLLDLPGCAVPALAPGDSASADPPEPSGLGVGSSLKASGEQAVPDDNGRRDDDQDTCNVLEDFQCLLMGQVVRIFVDSGVGLRQ